MSSSLHWRPVNHDGESFEGDANDLKFALREYWDGSFTEWAELGQYDIPFLKGIIVGAGPRSDTGRVVREVIKLIEKYDAIEVREVY